VVEPIEPIEPVEPVEPIDRLPDLEEPVAFFMVGTLDGWSHGVADSALNALPPVADPERPAEEGSWRSLEALLGSLPGPDTAGSDVVVVGPGEPVLLSAELRASHSVLLQRTEAGKLRLRVYPPGDGKRRAVIDVPDVLQLRVRSPGAGDK